MFMFELCPGQDPNISRSLLERLSLAKILATGPDQVRSINKPHPVDLEAIVPFLHGGHLDIGVLLQCYQSFPKLLLPFQPHTSALS